MQVRPANRKRETSVKLIIATIKPFKLEEVREALTEAGATVLGANCGTGPESFAEVVAAFREATSLPILVQPNAGLPELRKGDVVYPQTPEEMAGFVPSLVRAGASIIGCCCGSTPRHVGAVAEKVRELRSESLT